MHEPTPLDPAADPLEQFDLWMKEAQATALDLPEAVCLATTDSDGRPSARMVLFKGVYRGGLGFFTNYASRKARQLDRSGFAALVFHWRPLERQVRFEGLVERLTSEESDAYFESRSRGSRIGAWASHQSRRYRERDEILRRYEEVRTRFEGAEIPRPEFWGGYRLVPDRAEFWTGMSNRYHDRVEYRRGAGAWSWSRLEP